MQKVFFGAALVAVVLVPAASARSAHAHTVKLALVPLPKAAIGPAAQSFSLAHDSGTVSNVEAASHTSNATPGFLKKKLGRLNGYALEYGNAFSGGSGVTDVRTSVELYKTSAGAKRALVFWKKEDAKLRRLNNSTFSVTSVPVKVPGPARGTTHFAYLTSYSASNIVPVSGIDVQVADGRYVLDVIVTAGTASDAEQLAPKLAKKLDSRLRLARKGRLHAKPVKLPKLKAGPPPGGPDLSVLALRKSDLVGKVTVSKGYYVDPTAISDYSVYMEPAGRFDALDQEIEWYPFANEANFFADFQNAAYLTQPFTQRFDLSGIGDGAQGAIFYGPLTEAGNAALVCFSSGQLAEFIVMAGPISTTADDVKSVAQAAANRIDAAGLGS